MEGKGVEERLGAALTPAPRLPTPMGRGDALPDPGSPSTHAADSNDPWGSDAEVDVAGSDDEGQFFSGCSSEADEEGVEQSRTGASALRREPASSSPASSGGGASSSAQDATRFSADQEHASRGEYLSGGGEDSSRSLRSDFADAKSEPPSGNSSGEDDEEGPAYHRDNLSAREDDDLGNELVFEIGKVALGSVSGNPAEGPDEAREYSRIECDLKTTSSTFSFVNRVAFRRDRQYVSVLLGVLFFTLLLGLSNSRVLFKHHYLLSLLAALLISGAVNAAMIAAHYRLFRFKLAAPFALHNLEWIGPLHFSAVACAALAAWLEGWGVALSLTLLAIAGANTARIAHSSESLQFASVLLDMASELTTMDDQLAPVLRRIWVLFAVQNLWLMIWIGEFVDLASGSAQVSFVGVLFMLFALFWSTQAIRGIMSCYVTGAVCYRLVLAGEQLDGPAPSRQRQVAANRRVASVQEVLWNRSLTVGIGSVCAGALLIGPCTTIWAALAITHQALARLARHPHEGNEELGEGRPRTSSRARADLDDDPSSWRRSSEERPRRRKSSSSRASSAVKRLHGKFAAAFISQANRYGWARVALRGSSFSNASGEAWKNITASGLYGAIARDVTESLLSCWALGFGSATALVALVLLPPETHSNSGILFAFFAASFCVGAANASLLLEPLRASVGAIFVAYSEDPHCFEERAPIVHHRLGRLCEMTLFSTTGRAAPVASAAGAV